MKKILAITLTLILLLSFTLLIAGCEDLNIPNIPSLGDNDNTDDKNDGSTVTPPNSSTDDTNKEPDNDDKNDVPPVEDDFEDYGMNVITVELDNVNVKESGIYNTKEEVGAYLFLYKKLPSNYNTNKPYVTKNYTAQNKLSYTGGVFQNREGLLPKASGRTFTECDIGYIGGNRNALRIVFSSDWLIFYTDDHYASFSIMRFV